MSSNRASQERATVVSPLKNVLGKGPAAIVTNGHTYEVDRPEVIPMAEATAYFRPREQRMHRQFHVDSALQVHQRLEAHQ